MIQFKKHENIARGKTAEEELPKVTGTVLGLSVRLKAANSWSLVL